MIKLIWIFAHKIADAIANFENETFFVIFKHSVSNFFVRQIRFSEGVVFVDKSLPISRIHGVWKIKKCLIT